MRVNALARRLLIGTGLVTLVLGLLIAGRVAERRDALSTFPRPRPGGTPHHANDTIQHQQFLGISPDRLILYGPPGFKHPVDGQLKRGG